jgi:hypothetical protein
LLDITIISEKINALRELSKNQTITLDEVPVQFIADLQNYIVGETLSMRNGNLVVGKNLYKKWLNKIREKGFDYEIDFKQ